jgi:hypothetical protein
MTDPITPPPFELISQWHKEACKDPYNGGRFIESKVLRYITTAAAQWGSDQELEACCEWTQGYAECGDSLRAARRPKPLSLKEQALLQLDTLNADLAMHGRGCDLSQIRRALEQLND